MIAWLLARRLRRIRRRCFMFVSIEMCEPWGGGPRWIVSGVARLDAPAETVRLASGYNLRRALLEAESEAHRRFDQYGEPREASK